LKKSKKVSKFLGFLGTPVETPVEIPVDESSSSTKNDDIGAQLWPRKMF